MLKYLKDTVSICVTIVSLCATTAFSVYEYHQAAIQKTADIARMKAEIARMEIESMQYFKDELTSVNPYKRLRIAAFYAEISSDKDARKRWSNYKNIAKSEVPRYFTWCKKNGNADKKKQCEDINYAFEGVFLMKPKVFFHIKDSADTSTKERVNTSMNMLKTIDAYAVQGQKPDVIDAKNFPDNTEVRYFNTELKIDAQQLSHSLQESGIDATPKLIQGYKDKYHLEVWVTNSTDATSR